MVYGSEKLPDVAFKHPNISGVVVAFDISKLAKSIYGPMSAFVQSAGVRIVNKFIVEIRIKHAVDSMVQKSIPHGGLVDVPRFWIGDVESFVITVAISFLF